MAQFLIVSSFYNSKELNIFAANIKIIEMSNQLQEIKEKLGREFTDEEKHYIFIYDGQNNFEPYLHNDKLRYKKK